MATPIFFFLGTKDGTILFMFNFFIFVGGGLTDAVAAADDCGLSVVVVVVVVLVAAVSE